MEQAEQEHTFHAVPAKVLKGAIRAVARIRFFRITSFHSSLYVDSICCSPIREMRGHFTVSTNLGTPPVNLTIFKPVGVMARV